MGKNIVPNLVYPLKDEGLQKGLQVVSSLLEDIFQDSTILKGPMCVVFNDPSFGFPMFASGYPLGIRTSLHDPNNVCLLISQLTHELVHYIFYKCKIDTTQTAYRYEEIIAEAIALYALKQAPMYWTTEDFSLDSSEKEMFEVCHQQSVHNYTKQQMPIKPQVSKARWRLLEKNYATIRERHYQEVLYVYDQLDKKTIDPKLILNYTPYLLKNGSIDFEKWSQEQPSDTLTIIRKVQPIII